MNTDEDEEFEISEGVVLRGANACSIARRAWTRPKPKRQAAQTQGLVQWCRPRDHEFLHTGCRMINGKHTQHYQCCRCGYRVTI